MTLEVKDPRAETGWAERGWSLLESDGKLSVKKKEIAGEKIQDGKQQTCRIRAPVKASSWALSESREAPGPEQGERLWVQRERALSPETEARSPGWAWRKPRGQSRRRGLKRTTD